MKLFLNGVELTDQLPEIKQGREFEIRATVINQGEADVGSFKVRFYDSSVQIGEVMVNGLPHGQSAEVSISHTAGYPADEVHTIGVLADPEDEVPESDEQNNDYEHGKPYYVIGMPDLTIYETGIHFYDREGNILDQAGADQGEMVEIRVAIGNIGPAEAGNVRVCLYFERSPGIYEKIGEKVISGIEGHAYYEVSCWWRAVGAPEAIVKAVVDPPLPLNLSGEVEEISEDNNEAEKNIMVEFVRNLICTGVRFEPQQPQQGDLLTVYADVLNAWENPVSNVTVTFYDLSISHEHPIGETSIPSIEGGSYGEGSIRAQLRPGIHHIRAEVAQYFMDPDEKITDNFASWWVFVEPLQPNLVVEEPPRLLNLDSSPVSFSHDQENQPYYSLPYGDTFLVEVQIRNEGTAPPGNMAVLRAQDLYNWGLSDIGEIEFKIEGADGPQGNPPSGWGVPRVYLTDLQWTARRSGEHRIRVTVDPDQQIDEWDESDNSRESVKIIVAPPEHPDIRVANIIFDPFDQSGQNPRAGEDVTIKAVVEVVEYPQDFTDNLPIDIKFRVDGTQIGEVGVTLSYPHTEAEASLTWTAQADFEPGEAVRTRVVEVEAVYPADPVQADNSAAREITISRPMEPVLSISGFSASSEGEIYYGDSVGFQVEVLNSGAADASGVAVELIDEREAGDQVTIKTFDDISIQGNGGVWTGSYQWSAVRVPGGTHRIKAAVRLGGEAVDESEYFEFHIAIPLEVTVTPDNQATLPGMNLGFDVSVRNTAPEGSAPMELRISGGVENASFISADPPWDGQGEEGSVWWDISLGGGESLDISLAVRTDEDLGYGQLVTLLLKAMDRTNDLYPLWLGISEVRVGGNIHLEANPTAFPIFTGDEGYEEECTSEISIQFYWPGTGNIGLNAGVNLVISSGEDLAEWIDPPPSEEDPSRVLVALENGIGTARIRLKQPVSPGTIEIRADAPACFSDSVSITIAEADVEVRISLFEDSRKSADHLGVEVSIQNLSQFPLDGIAVKVYHGSDSDPEGELMGEETLALGGSESKTLKFYLENLPSSLQNHWIKAVAEHPLDHNLSNNELVKRFSMFYETSGGVPFKLKRDGFRFRNWTRDEEGNQNLISFILGLVSSDPSMNPIAPYLFLLSWLVGELSKIDSGGHCYGISAAALLFKESNANKPLCSYFDNPYDMVVHVDPDTYLPNFSAMNLCEQTVISEIERLHRTQIFCNLFIDLSPSTPQEIMAAYNSLKSYIAEQHRPVMIALWRNGGNGHAVMAYKMLEFPDDNKCTIYVYDPNFPFDYVSGDVTPITINLASFSISYGEYGDKILVEYPYTEIPSEAIARVKEFLMNRFRKFVQETWETVVSFLEKLPTSPIVRGSARSFYPLIKDEAGRRIGYVNGEFVNEIDGAWREIVLNSEIFHLPPHHDYQIEVRAESDMSLIIGAFVPGGKGFSPVAGGFEEAELPKGGNAAFSISKSGLISGLELDKDGDGRAEQVVGPTQLYPVKRLVSDPMEEGWEFEPYRVGVSDIKWDYGYSADKYTSPPSSIRLGIGDGGSGGRDYGGVKATKSFEWGSTGLRLRINYMVSQQTDNPSFGGFAGLAKISLQLITPQGNIGTYTYVVAGSTTDVHDASYDFCKEYPNTRYVGWDNEIIPPPGHGELEPPKGRWFTLDRDVLADFGLSPEEIQAVVVTLELKGSYLNGDRFELYFDDLVLSGEETAPAPPGTIVMVSPERRTGMKGETVQVDIEARGCEDIAGFQLDLSFDPAVLEALEAVEGEFLRGDGGQTFWKEPLIDNEKGEIRIACARISRGGVSGDGRLASIRFKGKEEGKSPIDINAVLSSSGGKRIDCRAVPGVVIIKASYPYDVNRNGEVDIFDLVIVGQHFGESPPGDPRADVNGDSKVDIFDLVLVGQHFGEENAPAPAPPAASASKSRAELRLKTESFGDILIADLMAKIEGDGLYGYQFDLSYDPSSLSLLSVERGELLGDEVYWKPPLISDGEAKDLACTRLGTAEGVEGEGSLARFKFKLKGDSHGGIRLNVKGLKLVDREGRSVKAVVMLENPPIPAESSLLQNYPNPANPETWIPFQLSKDARVVIRIYDCAGKLVREIDLGYRRAGIYRSKGKAAYWDGRNDAGEKVSSGLYFYTIQAGELTGAARKMLIVR